VATARGGQGGPEIPFLVGRTDAPSGASCPPEGRLPNGQDGEGPDTQDCIDKTAAHVRWVFDKMGFNDKEMVALIGAHALGRCHTDASGYEGPWTNAPTTFSSEYFRLMLEDEWQLRKWNGPEQVHILHNHGPHAPFRMRPPFAQACIY
jgi:cytochrome c peroxidase